MSARKQGRQQLDALPEQVGRRLGLDAIDRAVDLAAAIRDEGSHNVARIVDPLSEQELLALVTAMAAMLPADVDPNVALVWCDEPVIEWPDALVVSEAGRHDQGARDGTAVMARQELGRRLRVTQELQARRASRLRRAS